MTRVLILGGTCEARALAAGLEPAGDIEVVSSLAGRVREPLLPSGQVRVGGFGGVDGLVRWLGDNRVDLIVDATHPFAARMTQNAAEAAARVGVPMVALQRPGWLGAEREGWTAVDDVESAAAVLPQLGTRAFLTIGRQGVHAFAGLDALWFLVRAIDPPEGPVPPNSELIFARGPFTVGAETALIRRHRIDVLVTKDSGGQATAAKLDAAAALAIPVLLVRRPTLPPGIEVVDDVAGAVSWIESIT
ncbi:cobalt-precorrin-6A reductase [Rhodococcus sp. NPDC058521]|uniref:cobalt-precorrin-6A reductase n=1 Tax=Rhodococcus sp. NPDC058521 TaxID=3346536 RepID=UPI003666A14A